jgi:FkbM family methyltransferase
MNSFQLPKDDFFTRFVKTNSIHTFGKDSRDIALSYVSEYSGVIDIGAHVGISVLHWAELFKNIYAYEPMKDHFDCLKRNTDHLLNVELYNFAISNETKMLKGAYRTSKNSGSFQLIDDMYTQPSKKSPRELYSIPSHRLDDFIFSKINLIKIDVEGWEFEVLKGAVNTIKLHRPVLLVEYTGGSSKKSLHQYDPIEYQKLITELNYKPVKTSGDDTIYISE